jgi:fucose permease
VPQLLRDRVTWLTYAQLAIWAYFLYGFGPVLPLLREEQQTSRMVASLHGTALAVGGILAAVVSPILARRLGRHRLIWLGLGGISTAALGLLVARALPLTLGLVVVAALAGTFVVNSVVAGLTDHHGPAGPASISEANAVAAGVGLVAPLMVGASVSLGLGWRPGLALLIIPVLLLGAGFAVRLPEPTGETVRRARPMPRTYWLVLVSLFATSAVELCLTLWVADALRGHARVSPAVATAAVSMLLAGMLFGRLTGGRLVLRFRPTLVLLGALGVSAAGFAVFWVATVPWLALVGLFVCGAGVALHYPMGIGLAVAHSNGQPDLAVARATFAIGGAFGIAPFVLGAVSDRVGPHAAFLLLPLFLIGSAAVVVWLDRLPAARDGDAVGDREQDGVDPLVSDHHVVELDDRPRGPVGRGVEDPAVA